MRRAEARARWLAALVVGCGPSLDPSDPSRDEPARYARALCEALQACECYSPYPSEVECEEEYRGRLDSLMDLDAEFDDGCFDSVLGSDELQNCEMASDAPFAVQCTVLQGGKVAGAACDHHFGTVPPFGVDECAGDLVCRGGQCGDADDVLPPSTDGSACSFDEFGTRCPSAPNVYLFCSEDGVCRSQVEPGAACGSADACKSMDLPGYYCAGLGTTGVGTCQPRLGLGEVCAPEDWDACAYVVDVDEAGWCDFETRACTADLPKVCGYPSQR